MEGYRTVGYAVPQPIGEAATSHRQCYVTTYGVKVAYVFTAGVHATAGYCESIEGNGTLILVPY